MSVIIKEINNKYWLHSISHTPINLTPFTNPSAITDATYSIEIGEIKNLNNLTIDIEYNLDCYTDFKIIKRIQSVKHDDGLIYDDLILELIPFLIPNIK